MKRINGWICALTGLWYRLRYAKPIEGCSYVEIEHNRPAFVSVLRCEVCGRISVGWTERAPKANEVWTEE